ncbi:hypothetical protein GCM10011361_14190 [Muriicola marianensis]|uniref:Uncharacterized protein n=1 Tax=Muriicola marianensis TaxID=1324801 RepID=A0ABQ1QZ51_9FLAO|nr:hypothetical protein GCM10011361_14190 [Muriicola marianensis]
MNGIKEFKKVQSNEKVYKRDDGIFDDYHRIWTEGKGFGTQRGNGFD